MATVLTEEEKSRLFFLMSNLSPLRQKFIDEYMKNGFSATEAVLSAGYKTGRSNASKMGHELLQLDTVKEVISLLARDRVEKMAVSQEYVLKKLVKTLEAAEKANNYNATLRGLELIAKHLGMFIERTEITGKDGEALKYEKVENDAADFTRAIAGITKRSGAEGSPGKSTH